MLKKQVQTAKEDKKPVAEVEKKKKKGCGCGRKRRYS